MGSQFTRFTEVDDRVIEPLAYACTKGCPQLSRGAWLDEVGRQLKVLRVGALSALLLAASSAMQHQLFRRVFVDDDVQRSFALFPAHVRLRLMLSRVLRAPLRRRRFSLAYDAVHHPLFGCVNRQALFGDNRHALVKARAFKLFPRLGSRLCA